MKHQYRATVFLRFSVDEDKMKEFALDVEMPPAGFLHDDLLELLDGTEGVTVVESIVIKECTPLPTPLELEVIQTICQGCGLLKETNKTPHGQLCLDCVGSVVPIRRGLNGSNN